MTSDQHRPAHRGAEADVDPASAPAAAADEEDWDARPHGGRTRNEWIKHVLRRAADRRHLAEFEMARGDVEGARLLLRSALMRELDVASLRGEQTLEEMRVASELVETWTGTSVEELIATARAIVAATDEAP